MQKKCTSIYILFFIVVGSLGNCFAAKKVVPLDDEDFVLLARKISINLRVKDFSKSQEVIRDIDHLWSKKDDPLTEYVRSWNFLRQVLRAQNEEVFKYFVKKGLNLNMPDSRGEYIVHMVVRERLYAILSFLCSLVGENDNKIYLVNLNMQNREGFTPLVLAQRMGNERAEEILRYTRRRSQGIKDDEEYDDADLELLGMRLSAISK